MSEKKDRYAQRGVSAGKEGIHKATAILDKGLFPNAFCQIHPHLDGDPKKATISHADGAGTKSSLAYAYWRETGDMSVWRGIAQDVISMNIDDMFCAGLIDGPIGLTLHINRNSHLLSDDTGVVAEIIAGAQDLCDKLKGQGLGINMKIFGGETADVPDLVRTICVDANAVCSIQRRHVIDPDIKPGQIIVGFSSSGMSLLEEAYNSGIGSNGLTSARHDMLAPYVGKKYPETYDPASPRPDLVYCGKYRLDDPGWNSLTIGQALLSPTRVYAPAIRDFLVSINKEKMQNRLGAIIHCTGGGQTKVLKFTNSENPVKIIKDTMFPVPEIFCRIQETGTQWKDMYRTFNMGHLIEMYIDEQILPIIKHHAAVHGIDAKVIGHVEAADDGKTEVIVRHQIDGDTGEFHYS